MSAPHDSVRSDDSTGALVRQGLLVVVGCLVLGVLGGLLWYQLWNPAQGVVVASPGCAPAEQCWTPTPPETGRAGDFSGTALYTLVALGAGLVAGLVASLAARRSELVTLGALLLGTAVAGVVMARVGVWLGPADPEALAASAEVGTRLPDDLQVVGVSPYVVMPFGGLLALVLVYFIVPREWPARSR
ncbi:hypothetical protein [Nocardioides pantholopis]|uniref:hypothetical protein n=1 Tax=Nocardioides pantholopis TaxID=2483798 RepID=UPI000F091052|nr:hypothetical protein [Nocardioides pantholopis]